MTNAQTGNTMIPSNPGIVQQQVRDGAQQVAPMQTGYYPPQAMQPPAQQQPVQQQQPEPQAPPVESYDFWQGIEQRIEPTEEYDFPQPQQQPQQPSPAQPQQQPQPQFDGQGQPQPGQLSPEQQAAILEAQAATMPQQQQQVQQQPQAPQPAQAQNYAQFEQQTITHLAQTEYAIPEDVARQMVAEPEKVYPQLAARMHVRLASQIGNAIQQMLPTVVDQMVEAKVKAHTLEQEFFQNYKELADPRFRPVVANALRMARQINPQASPQQIMADGATLAAMRLRVQLNGGAQQQVVAQQPYQQPTVVQQQLQPQRVAAPPQQQPFRPAQGGGAFVPTQQQVQKNEFEELAMDPNW